MLAVGVEHRDKLWREVLAANPKVVICEKPMAASLVECDEIVSSCSAAGVDLVVNFPRRFLAQSARAKELISSGKLGGLQAGHVWYGKGVANNGSHMIDLLLFLFGSGWNVDQVRLVGSGYENGDSDASFRMSKNGASITFTPVDVTNFEFAEIDLVFESGRLRFTDHAFHLVENIGLASAGFDGMLELAAEQVVPDVSITNYQFDVLNRVVESINDGSNFDQDVEDAISTSRIIETVLESHRVS